MSHRAEEKERRRQERIAQEEAARRAAARKRTLQIGGGAVLGLAVIAVIAIVALAGAGSKDKSVDTTKLTADAKAAGCTFSQFKSEGRNHTAGKVTYKTNPPTSGNHNPTPAQDGIYRAGNSPPKENFVHTLEHGRIEFQYKPGTPAADVAKLRRLAEEPLNGTAGYHILLFENNTDMPAQFAAAAWTKSITCPTLSTQALGAMREFRAAFTDKGPELIP
jgi:uncharacterized protein DUF3105